MESSTESSEEEPGPQRPGAETPSETLEPEPWEPENSCAHWYSCKKVSHLKPGHDGVLELVSYNAALLVTMRVLFVRTGTILTKKVLWTEEAITMVAFLFTVAVMRLIRYHDEGHPEQRSTIEDLSKQTVFFEGFCLTMTHVATFLLTFFTSLNFGRWQRLRTQGVEKLWIAAGQMSMVMSTFVTSDPDVLSAIQRYARASLMLIFMSRRGNAGLAALARRGLLKRDEVEKLQPAGSPMFASIAIWTWLAALVGGIKAKGMIKSEQVARFLLDALSQGHEAAHLMVSQLTAPVPLAYVWLISVIVKIHNFVHAVLYGIMVSVDAFEHNHKMTLATQLLFVFMITLIFHALLILNQELADPFDGMSQDACFPMAWLDRSLQTDLSNYCSMASSVPSWIEAAGLAEDVPKKVA